LLPVGELEEAGDALDRSFHVEMVAAGTCLEYFTLDFTIKDKLVGDVSADPVVLSIHEGDRDVEVG